MSLDIEGIEGLKLLLKRFTDIPNAAAAEMGILAEDTKNLARNMAPEEFGDLKDAIKMRLRDGFGRFARGINAVTYEIYVDTSHAVSDERQVKTGDTTVGDYAWAVHEYMGYGNTPGAPMKKSGKPFMPSAKSVAEGLKFGVDAGGRFMERSGEEMREKIDVKLGALVFKDVAAMDL